MDRVWQCSLPIWHPKPLNAPVLWYWSPSPGSPSSQPLIKHVPVSTWHSSLGLSQWHAYGQSDPNVHPSVTNHRTNFYYEPSIGGPGITISIDSPEHRPGCVAQASIMLYASITRLASALYQRQKESIVYSYFIHTGVAPNWTVTIAVSAYSHETSPEYSTWYKERSCPKATTVM